jgi:hypothetical protein
MTSPAPNAIADEIRALLCRGTYADRLELSRIAARLRRVELQSLPADLVAKLDRAVIS